MKIVTKTTFVIGKGKTVAPGVEIDIKDDDEAQSLIDRGLAELPVDTAAIAESSEGEQ